MLSLLKFLGRFNLKLYVRHHGESLYQRYRNYADSAIFPFLPICFQFYSGHFSNANPSEVCGPIDFKFHVMHSRQCLY